MRRILAVYFMVSCLSLVVSGQNLVQNPGFEYLPQWDSLWVLSLSKPSTRTAVATRVTNDAHEGNSCVELSNTDDGKWTYIFTDVVQAPISFKANRSYEIVGWMKSVERGKEAEVSILWDDSDESHEIYKETPDPMDNPDWFRVSGTVTFDEDFHDGYLSLGFKSDKDHDNVIGKLLFDDFSVTLIPDGTDSDIWDFSIPQQIAPEIIDPVQGTISIRVPFGTDLSALVPDQIIISEGASISPAAGEARDFTSPVIYTVTAQNGIDTRDWTVSVTIEPLSTATDITFFSVPDLIAPTTINPEFHFVSGRVSYGTDVSDLTPSIGISRGASIEPAPGSSIDFSSPVIYTVTAEDGITSQDWVVFIQVEPNTETDITSFEIPELLVPATIDKVLHTVTATVRQGTDLSALIPSIGVSEGAVIDPASGVLTDFSSPVVYTVTALDGVSTQDWTVNVIEGPPSSQTEILSFEIPEMPAPATIHGEVQLVTGSVPYGTDLTSLVPSITVSYGASIHPGPGISTDFSAPVIYTVTAEDGTTVEQWLVTIQVLPNNETDITGFTLAEQTGVYSIIYVNHTIDIEVGLGTDITSLAPVFSLSPGATIAPPNGESRDFTNSVDYTVTAEDGVSVQDWLVSIYLEKATGNQSSNAESFRIYPNPSSDLVFIELSGETRIILYDLMGRVCFRKDRVQGELILNVSDFKEGMYLISLQMEDGSLQHKKLIIR